MRHVLAALITTLLAGAASAQQAVASESRDTASVVIGARNYAVSRIARECLATVGRPESPQEFVAQWQQRNEMFVVASSRYIEARLQEAGTDKRDALLREIGAAVRSNGESLVRQLLQGGRESGCMKAVTLLDTGTLNINRQAPMFEDIEALVRWAAK